MRKILYSVIALAIILISGIYSKVFSENIPSGIGVNINFTEAQQQDLDLIKEAGFNIARTDLKWAKIEAQKGTYKWTEYDQLINGLTSRGIRAYLILDYNNYNYLAAHELDAADIPVQIDGFKRFASAAVARYKGKGIIWEIWNEPNLDNFWRPVNNPNDYMRLLKSTVPELRKADPDAIIVAPAVAFVANTFSFLETCAQNGLFDYIDAVSVHPYKNATPESGNLDYLYDTVRNLIKKYNPDNPNLPIVGGEFGFSTAWSGITEEIQGNYLPRQLLYHKIKNIPFSVIYDLRNDGTDPANVEHNFGILRHDYTKRPAFYNIKSLNTNLKNTTYTKRLTSDPADYLLEFNNPTKKMLAAWTTKATHTVTVYGKTITISQKPVYIDVTSYNTPKKHIILKQKQ